MVVLDGYKDVPEPLVGDSIFDPHYPFLTTVSRRFDLNIDRVQRVWISGDHVDKRLPVIGLTRDVSALGKLSEHIELTSVPDAVVVLCHANSVASASFGSPAHLLLPRPSPELALLLQALK